MASLFAQLPVILFAAIAAFAGLAAIPNITGRLRKLGMFATFFLCWIGLYVGQYLAGDTLGDFMQRHAGPTFCKIVPIGLCVQRLAEDEKKAAEKVAGAKIPFNADITKTEQNPRQLPTGAPVSPVVAPELVNSSPTRPVAVDNILPPIVVTSPPISKPAPSKIPKIIATKLLLGQQLNVPEGASFAISPVREFTTTVIVLSGSVSVMMDGVEQFVCAAGGSFRIFTRGWSSFALKSLSTEARMEVAELVPGDLITEIH